MLPLILFPFLCPLAFGQDLAAFVNPLIGTADDGHVFPGQYLKHVYVSQVQDGEVFVTCILKLTRP